MARLPMKITTTSQFAGAFFNGRMEYYIQQYCRAVENDLADIGRDWIAIDAMAMDRSGRGGTGRAAEGVRVIRSNLESRIWGDMKQGEVWWPWLEGVSKRNNATRFKGYHTFRSTRFKLNKYALPFAQKKIRVYLPKMGGK